jgi:glycolate oxidase iron-sulfur subunit
VKSLLPVELRDKVPDAARAGTWPAAQHPRKMLVLEGCVQPSLAPNIDASMARVLDRIGVSLLRVGGGCCGALPYHLDAAQEALTLAKRNIDAWWPHVERGAEAIIVTSSACGVMVKDYAYLLRNDATYGAKAKRISELARDSVEVISAEWKKIAPKIAMDHGPQTVAFHSPCTLQHGQKIRGRVEEILAALGLELTPVANGHLCCGSAGTYSILQPELSVRLRSNKLAALEAGQPEVIVSANIGCITHLGGGTKRPVRHWIEVLDRRMVGGVPPPEA